MRILTYGNRTLAAAYVLGWLAWGTSIIGEPSPCQALTWQGAWSFAGVLAAAVLLGWMARDEAERKN